jgi:hypothetical protein
MAFLDSSEQTMPLTALKPAQPLMKHSLILERSRLLRSVRLAICATIALPVLLGAAKLQTSAPVSSAPEIVELEVETRIRPPDPVSGMKSLQVVKVNFDKRKVTQTYKTGDTYGIPSARDKFHVASVDFEESTASFVVTGRTASGVQVMPDIDYRFEFEVDSNGSVRITRGCHDGYPSYVVRTRGHNLYRFDHKSIRLYKLVGDCDVDVGRRELPPK